MFRLGVLVLFLVGSTSFAGPRCDDQGEKPNLAETMEEMGDAFKLIRRRLAKNDMSADAVAENQALNAIMYVAIPMATEIEGLSPADHVLFKKLMAQALVFGYAMEEAILGQDLDLAVEQAKLINEKRKEAHEIFN